MLRPFLVKEVEKYSFIEKCENTGSRFILYYGGGKKKTVPVRASIGRLQEEIRKIQIELKGEKHGTEYVLWTI